MQYTSRHNDSGMSNGELQHIAPSIFATQPYHGMSDRYTFIPTIAIVDKMRAEGFSPVFAAQSRSRIAGKQEFTKHLIRFRDVRAQSSPMLANLGGLYPEVVLTNAHDGASTYRINAGVFRAVCINGLMVGDSFGGQMRVRHSGSADGIIEATYSIVEEFPNIIEQSRQFSNLQLSAPEQKVFASAALSLKYDEPAKSPITVEQLIRPRRSEDRDPNLWNTFNTVQEHLVTGGLRGRNPETFRRVRTRAVTGISENTKLNQSLWTLAEEMKKLKTA